MDRPGAAWQREQFIVWLSDSMDAIRTEQRLHSVVHETVEIMSAIYLTPASLSFLTQFILSLSITFFLVRYLRNRTTQLVLLTGFFAGVTAFIGLLFLDAAFAPFPRLLVVYAENSVLALDLVLLLQFAYHFPQLYTHRKWEAYASLIVSMAYLLWEASFAVYRYVSLLQHETVYYRPLALNYANAVVLLWVPIAFLRQCIAADSRPVNGLLKLWKPQGKEAQGARFFIFVFAIPFLLGVINILRGYSIVTTIFYNISLSIGILVALWLFASAYINFIPGGVSILHRLSTLILTLFLALLGSASWLIAPPYIGTYHLDLTDHQTLRFAPNASGGYDVTGVNFSFKTDLGDRVPLQFKNEARNHEIDFPFPFYGRTYSRVYVVNSGVVSLGQPFWQSNMQARGLNVPAIFPLLIELDPNAGGGVHARQEPERLTLTWDHLPSLYRPEAIFTLQVVLHRNGVFDVTYNGLPLPFRFGPDETPSANPWLRGATPGEGQNLYVNLDNFSAPLETGHRPIIQNYNLDFRRHLHTFMLPLAWVIVGGSLLLLLALPILVNFSLIRPLKALIAGVGKMEAGDYDTQVAVQTPDEIGFLTRAFNRMTAQLGDYVHNLETRVAVRTAALDATNAQLRAEMAKRKQAKETIIAQQRALAAMEERERMSRDLHDGLGQTLGYISIQTQAIQIMLTGGQNSAAQTNLDELTRVAHDANADLRHFIQELRTEEATAQDFWQALRRYLRQFQADSGIKITLNLPDDPLLYTFGPAIKEQILRIIQEALTNVRKHAAASQVEVIFDFTAAAANVIIADDGRGFDPDSLLESGTHFGLTMMRERAETVGAQVKVCSAPGQGTWVLVHVTRLGAAPDDSTSMADLVDLRRGSAPLSPEMTARVVSRFSGHNAAGTSTAHACPELTRRQQEILELVAQGLIYKEIAHRLHLSEKTIKYHMAQIMGKLGIENRV